MERLAILEDLSRVEHPCLDGHVDFLMVIEHLDLLSSCKIVCFKGEFDSFRVMEMSFLEVDGTQWERIVLLYNESTGTKMALCASEGCTPAIYRNSQMTLNRIRPLLDAIAQAG